MWLIFLGFLSVSMQTLANEDRLNLSPETLQNLNERALAIQPSVNPSRAVEQRRYLGGLVEEFRVQNQVHEIQIRPTGGAPAYFLTNPLPTYGGRERDSQQLVPSWRLWSR